MTDTPIREEYIDYSPSSNEAIGIDFGVKTLATVSNGNVYQNINKTSKVKRFEKRLRRLQRKVSRKYQMNKEGNRYRKTCNIIKIEKEMTRSRTRDCGFTIDRDVNASQNLAKLAG